MRIKLANPDRYDVYAPCRNPTSVHAFHALRIWDFSNNEKI